jgi:hypothetical protein
MKEKLLSKLYLIIGSIIIIHFLFVFATSPTKPYSANPHQDSSFIAGVEMTTDAIAATEEVSDVTPQKDLYLSLSLGKLGLSRTAYDYAMKGYNHFLFAGKLSNKNIVSIVDFSLPSSKKRLFILDVKNQKLLFHTYVSHGRNSGRETATQFSNAPESFKSSLGFYITKDTYIGKHGFSLKLQGEERGINDNAMNRAIVMHNASYVDESLIRSQGYIGRSLGCPAVPEQLHKPIIEKIKNGSCLFMYSPDKYYASHSPLLSKIV